MKSNLSKFNWKRILIDDENILIGDNLILYMKEVKDYPNDCSLLFDLKDKVWVVYRGIDYQYDLSYLETKEILLKCEELGFDR
jgi:hypothetical protein